MPATYDRVRQLALALPGVVEGMSYGTPSLHVGRKFMARLKEDGETLVIKTTPERRAHLMAEKPDTFFLTDHYRNSPMVLVNLLSVRGETLHELVDHAWRLTASKKMILSNSVNSV